MLKLILNLKLYGPVSLELLVCTEFLFIFDSMLIYLTAQFKLAKLH